MYENRVNKRKPVKSQQQQKVQFFFFFSLLKKKKLKPFSLQESKIFQNPGRYPDGNTIGGGGGGDKMIKRKRNKVLQNGH